MVHFIIFLGIKSEGLITIVKDNKEARWFLQQVMALPLLPHEQIVLQFRILKSGLSDYLKEQLRRFSTYFEKF